MKKLLFIFIPLLIWSCSDDNHITEKVFEFHSIRWIKEAGDGETFEDIIIPAIIKENRTTQMIYIISSTDDYVNNTSVFSSNDPLAFTLEWDEKPFMIDVPTSNVNTTDYFYPKGYQVPYEQGETILEPERKTETTSLPPYCRIIQNGTIEVKKLRFTYEIILAEITTGEEKIIRGKWNGSFYNSSSIDAVIEKIPQ